MEEKMTDTLFTEKVAPVVNARRLPVVILFGIIIGIPLVAVITAILFLIPTSTRVNEDTPSVTDDVITTPTESEAPSPMTTAMPTVTVPVLQSEVYDNKYVTYTIPKGWNKVLSEDGKSIVKLEKNGYYFYTTWGTVTGGGYGYPYDGVCSLYKTRKSNVTYKIGTRYDEYFDLTKDAPIDTSGYAEPPRLKTKAGYCNIDPEIQNGKIVWLGSRFGISYATGISATTYFSVKSDASVELFVLYSHKSIEDSKSDGKTYAFPVLDSAELKVMIAEMDAIAKTVVFKKTVLE